MSPQQKQLDDKPGEFEIIKRFFRPLAMGNPASLALQDDVALLKFTQATRVVLTADAVVAGVHFFEHDSPALIARKSLRVNISDLAAKGAEPLGYLMTIALPAHVTAAWLQDFTQGLQQDQQEFGLSLLGGDTVSTPGPLTISIMALGRLPSDIENVPQRSHAQQGDLIGVTGTLGDAALGLQLLQGKVNLPLAEQSNFLKNRYWLPQPKLNLGINLVKQRLIHAMMDISDGLMGDLNHICQTSRVGAKIDSNLIPLSPGVQSLYKKNPGLLSVILTGGDDYELLFTASPDLWETIQGLGQQLKVPVHCIGHIVAGNEIQVLNSTGQIYPIAPKGYQHF